MVAEPEAEGTERERDGFFFVSGREESTGLDGEGVDFDASCEEGAVEVRGAGVVGFSTLVAVEEEQPIVKKIQKRAKKKKKRNEKV